MPRIEKTFADNQGKFFSTIEEATISDISEIFREGGAEGMSIGLSRTVLKNRKFIEKIFSEMDDLIENVHPVDQGTEDGIPF